MAHSPNSSKRRSGRQTMNKAASVPPSSHLAKARKKVMVKCAALVVLACIFASPSESGAAHGVPRPCNSVYYWVEQFPVMLGSNNTKEWKLKYDALCDEGELKQPTRKRESEFVKTSVRSVCPHLHSAYSPHLL